MLIMWTNPLLLQKKNTTSDNKSQRNSNFWAQQSVWGQHLALSHETMSFVALVWGSTTMKAGIIPPEKTKRQLASDVVHHIGVGEINSFLCDETDQSLQTSQALTTEWLKILKAWRSHGQSRSHILHIAFFLSFMLSRLAYGLQTWEQVCLGVGNTDVEKGIQLPLVRMSNLAFLAWFAIFPKNSSF